jgi:hypothetical protein
MLEFYSTGLLRCYLYFFLFKEEEITCVPSSPDASQEESHDPQDGTFRYIFIQTVYRYGR